MADYLDRVIAGETFEPTEIVAEHPEHGQEILEELRSWIDVAWDPAKKDLGTLGEYRLLREIGRGARATGAVAQEWRGHATGLVA